MSNIVYHRTGTTLRDAVILQDGSGAFVTGLVDGDFTKRLSKDGTGNQVVTGITVTEVDDTNNPGEYEIEIAASAFVAAAGTYVLQIVRTSDPTYTFEQVYVVNATGGSSSTPASFTATVSDGRVMYSGAAVEGATVYLTLGSAFWSQTTTDASGLWGPVYLTDGTYTVRVQKSGYAQSTATITVSGATVTGPSADITLAVGSTTDARAASQLWAYARRMAVDLTGTKADIIIKGAVNDALDMVSSERLWPHLLRRSFLALHGPYNTGTITITAGSANVELTGGTFPAWAASGKLWISNQTLDISTRTDDDTLTLDQVWGGDTITAGTYILYQNEYDLPDDLWRFHRNLPGQRWGWGAQPGSIAEVLEAEASAIYGQAFPDIFAIANGAFLCWPYPNDDAMLAYTYYARPARLTTDTDIADWDPVHLEVLNRAIDYQLARQIGKVIAGDANTTLAAYKEALSRDTVQDKSATDLPSVGSSLRVGRDAPIWKRI